MISLGITLPTDHIPHTSYLQERHWQVPKYDQALVMVTAFLRAQVPAQVKLRIVGALRIPRS